MPEEAYEAWLSSLDNPKKENNNTMRTNLYEQTT